MAFPVIPTTGNGRLLSQNQNDTTATRTFPNLSSLTKSSGDLLIAIVVAYERSAAGATFSSWGGGFTELADVDGGASTMAVGIATKTSTGSETGTFTVTQGGPTGHCSLFLMSISGWHGTTPAELTALAVNTAAAADPGALDPGGWAAEDTLWIAVAGNGETNTGGTWTGLGTPTPPTNFTNANSPGIGTDAVGGIHSAVAFRQNNTSSEDVGTWTGQDVSNARNCALLMAVRPVAGGVTTSTAGSGVTGFSGAAHREGTRVKVGLGVLGIRRYAGTGILAPVGSAADEFTATETGSGILHRIGSGAAVKTSAGIEKTGSGTRELKGAASDAFTATETGSGTLIRAANGTDAFTATETGQGVLVRAGSAADEATFTETGQGVLVRSGSGADATTFVETGAGILERKASGASQKVGGPIEKTGAGVRELKASGADVAAFTETGSGIFVLAGSGADATTFIETGAAVLPRVGSAADAVTYVKSGFGRFGSQATTKEGAGVRGHAGSAADAAEFGDSGAGVSAHIGSASDAVTFIKLGAGTLARVGSGADAVEFTERGSGILAAVGSGPKEVGGGTIYVKTGFGRIGARLSISATGAGILGMAGSGASLKVGSKLGSGIRGFAGSASDAATWQRTSKLVRYEFPEPPVLEDDYPPSVTLKGSGVAVKIGAVEKTGAGVRGFVGAGADAFTATEAGSATRVLVASGSDAVTFTETGAGILERKASGVATRAGGADKTGSGVRGHSALGADAVVFTEAGAGISSRVGSGEDAAAFAETGTGIRGHVGSGASFRGAAFEKTGMGTSTRAGGGIDAITYIESGTAAAVRSGSGFDASTFVERGSGILDPTGSGAKFKLGEFVKFGHATTAIIGSGSSEVSMQLPPSGTVSSSHTGRFSRVRVGRITRAREGGVVTS